MQEFTQDLEQLKFGLAAHQHQGFDGSSRLNTLDWRILSKRELNVAASSIVLSDLPTKQFLRLLISHGSKTSGGNNLLRFNNDSGVNYTSISRENATARTSATSIDLFDALGGTTQFFFVIDIVNIIDLQKSIVSEGVQIPTSAATTQIARQVYGTWINVTAQISRIDVIASAGNFPIGSRAVLWGSSF